MPLISLAKFTKFNGINSDFWPRHSLKKVLTQFFFYINQQIFLERIFQYGFKTGYDLLDQNRFPAILKNQIQYRIVQQTIFHKFPGLHSSGLTKLDLFILISAEICHDGIKNILLCVTQNLLNRLVGLFAFFFINKLIR